MLNSHTTRVHDNRELSRTRLSAYEKVTVINTYRTNECMLAIYPARTHVLRRLDVPSIDGDEVVSNDGDHSHRAEGVGQRVKRRVCDHPGRV
jgi:hypothetical protein